MQAALASILLLNSLYALVQPVPVTIFHEVGPATQVRELTWRSGDRVTVVRPAPGQVIFRLPLCIDPLRNRLDSSVEIKRSDIQVLDEDGVQYDIVDWAWGILNARLGDVFKVTDKDTLAIYFEVPEERRARAFELRLTAKNVRWINSSPTFRSNCR